MFQLAGGVVDDEHGSPAGELRVRGLASFAAVVVIVATRFNPSKPGRALSIAALANQGCFTRADR